MKTAVVFPGQGSQQQGMGAELAARWPSAAARFAEASGILGYDLLKLCAEGPEEKLADTFVAQPALYTAGFATWEVLATEGLAPDCVAGHSLGEYTACAAAGAFPFAAGLKAVQARAVAMAAAVERRPGAMLAVMGAAPADVDAWGAAAAPQGPVLVANRNAPDQLIVSGTLEAVEAVEASAKAAGVRAIRLKVAGAFHSPLMATAAERMREVLAGVVIADPRIPVVGNVTGDMLTTASALRGELEVQLVSAVKWDACVKTLRDRGVSLVIESGPGKVLAGLVRKNDRNIETLSTGKAADLEGALSRIKGG